MRNASDSTGNYEIALANAEKGFVSIPCIPGTKIPRVKWKPYQTRMPTQEELAEWFKETRNNIAILTSGMVVFDVDDPEKAELVIAQCGDTPHKLRTPRGGIHLGFRKRKGSIVMNQVRIKGQPIDIRTDGGLEMIPNSETEDGKYEWLGEGLFPIAELPVARIGWTRERTRKQLVQRIEASGDLTFMEFRASRWLERVDGALSGEGGHRVTFRVACRLTHNPPAGFGLGFEAAMRLMLAIFNPKCRPAWSEKELSHKLEDALKKRK
jgi:hypothetical protein